MNLGSTEQPPSQGVKRSRKGCPECKTRKIKCDEKRPQCSQCSRSGRTCTILDSVFRQDAYSFAAPRARQQVPTTTTAEQVASHTHEQLCSTSSWIEMDDPGIGFSQPSNLASPSVSYANASSPVPAVAIANAVSSVFAVAPETPHTIETCDSRMADTVVIVSPGQPCDSLGLAHDEGELGFFLRLFIECTGPWMDLFNEIRCFTLHLPTLSRRSALVHYSVCAVAAKQLGQMDNPKSRVGETEGQKLAAKKLTSNSVDFNWYGAKYYEKAIQLLARQISQDSPGLSAHPSPSELYNVELGASEESPLIALIAACMLSLYEMLSATVSMRAWGGHLNGLYKLFKILQNGALFQFHPMVLNFQVLEDTPAIQASFWWFVFNDMEQSFATKNSTRVDIDNLILWRNMGLPLSQNGQLAPDTCSKESSPQWRDTIASRALIRLLCQLVDILSLSQSSSESSTLNHNTIQHEKLSQVENEINEWHLSISSWLQPDYRRKNGSPEPSLTHEFFGQEIWFSRPLAAIATMQYHMAQILLLVTKPIPEGLRNQYDLLRAYHNLQSKLRIHASEIFSIALGKPDDSVTARMLQPLFVAGRCLTEKQDRRFLVRMIRAIETDMGLMSEYRIKDLLEEWSVSYEDLDLSTKEVVRRQEYWG